MIINRKQILFREGWLLEQPETLIEWKFESITNGSWRLYEDHGGYIVDHGSYMRIMTVICSVVGAKDTCVSKNVYFMS